MIAPLRVGQRVLAWLMIILVSGLASHSIHGQGMQPPRRTTGGAGILVASIVRVVPNEAARRVDILVNDKPFTSYIYPDTLKKLVLYPVRTSS